MGVGQAAGDGNIPRGVGGNVAVGRGVLADQVDHHELGLGGLLGGVVLPDEVLEEAVDIGGLDLADVDLAKVGLGTADGGLIGLGGVVGDGGLVDVPPLVSHGLEEGTALPVCLVVPDFLQDLPFGMAVEILLALASGVQNGHLFLPEAIFSFYHLAKSSYSVVK